MDWLPPPRDFRQELHAILEISSPSERLHKLTSLAQFRLSFLETIQLDNALGQVATACSKETSRFRLAVAASCTIDHLLPAIRVAGARRRMLIEIHAGLFGQYRQELLSPASALYRFHPEAILLSLSAREALPAVPLAATADEADRALSAAVRELCGMWSAARQHSGAVLVQQSFLDTSEPLFGSYDRLVPGSPGRLVARLNDLVAEAAHRENVLWLDLSKASARDGIDAWFDVGRWLQGKIEVAPQSAPMYGELLTRVIAAQRGQSKKCLVLDLDNTLWGGVIGDDGLEGIVLGQGSARGEAHLALQRYAKLLQQRGVILAVCSKNELQTAEAVFLNHPEMALRRADIAAFVANWNDKAENLKAIAQQLNIGLDSLVFVDDNPAERARVRESLPMVAVPELPKDPAHYVRCVADAGYFEAVSFTSDDSSRAEQYAANTERDALRGASQSMEDFLRSLGMSVVFGPVTDVDLVRATQLINKTNQFNTTTRRYSADEVSRFCSDTDCLTLQFRLVDSFGDNGLVSVMILRPVSDDPAVMEIDTWVMSCRVFGRQLEQEAMNIAIETARSRGVNALRADYIPTEKNGVIQKLYESLGFSAVPQPDLSQGVTRWRIDTAAYQPRPTFILRRARHHD
jgi:FkbH-like protein